MMAQHPQRQRCRKAPPATLPPQPAQVCRTDGLSVCACVLSVCVSVYMSGRETEKECLSK